MPVLECATGIIDIADSNMCGGVKVTSTQKGFDLREFSLISFGGAGALHAARIARELGMRKTIVPLYPGNFSAIGAELAEVRYDYVRTIVQAVDAINVKTYNDIYDDMKKEAVRHLSDEGFATTEIVLLGTADMRYAGQAWELTVTVPVGINSLDSLAAVANDFQQLHKMTYGYILEDDQIMIVNLRLSATGIIPKLEFKKKKILPNAAEAARKGSRQVYFGKGFVATPIYNREKLTPGSVVKGPVIIEEYASTIVVFPGDVAHIDAYSNIIIERED
jgi:N-methylhydantoinase A